MKATCAILLAFLFSCSGNLHPVNDQNSTTHTIDTEKAVVYFNYLGKEGQMMIFDVKIKNTSKETLYIDPDLIQYKASLKQSSLYSVAPRDPHPLTEYDVGLRLRSRMRSGDTFKFLINAVSAGIQAYSGTSWAEGFLPGFLGDNSELLGTAVTFTGEIASSTIESKNEQLEEDIGYVPTEILKKSFLEPGHSLQGKVFFDEINRTRYYEFLIPVETDTFSFAFSKDD